MSARSIKVEAVAAAIYTTHAGERTPTWNHASPGVRRFVIEQARAATIECVRQFKAMGEEAEVAECPCTACEGGGL